MPDPRPIILAVLCALVFSAGWTVRGWQEDAALLAIEQATKATSAAAAAAIAAIKVENKTIVQAVQRTIVEKPVYRECMHSPETAAQINQALTR